MLRWRDGRIDEHALIAQHSLQPSHTQGFDVSGHCLSSLLPYISLEPHTRALCVRILFIDQTSSDHIVSS